MTKEQVVYFAYGTLAQLGAIIAVECLELIKKCQCVQCKKKYWRKNSTVKKKYRSIFCSEWCEKTYSIDVVAKARPEIPIEDIIRVISLDSNQ